MLHGGGKKTGESGRGKSTGHPAAHKGGEKGGAASASRSTASRSASANKATAHTQAERRAAPLIGLIMPLGVPAGEARVDQFMCRFRPAPTRYLRLLVRK